MTMANSFKLTKRNFNRVKNKYQQHRAFRCPKCHEQFEIGDVIIRVGASFGRYFHESCLEGMRV